MSDAILDRSRTRWGIVAIGFLAGIVGMFQTAKMSIALVDVQRDIGLTLVGASWSTTAVSITGALFGVVAGRIVAEFGAVRTLVAALALSAVAAVSTAVLHDPAAFLSSRIVEGIGYLFVCTAAPAMMADAAATRDKGVALAIWGAFVPVSVSIMAFAGPFVVAAAGWRALFLASAAAVGAVGAVVALAAADRVPLGPRIGGRLAAVAAEAPRVHARLYRSSARLGLGTAFMAFAAMQVGLIALTPAYLTEGRGLDAATAGAVLSVTAPFAIVGTALAGFLQRRGVADRPTAVAGFLAMAASAAGEFLVGSDPLAVAAAGAVFFTAGGVVGSVIFAGLPRRGVGPAGVALLSGLIVQFGNLGALTGAPILAAVAESAGWSGIPVALAAMAALGVAGTLAAG